jgi:phosphatidylserine decarboxylase
VNPAALAFRGEIFATNERHVSILETKNFGKLAYVEVGAMMVGLIRQTHAEADPFRRGDEKGTFLFGASTVILLGQRGRWVPDADLLEQTSKFKRETLIRLGQGIAKA